MAPIDGTISTKMNIKHPQMNDVNISKAQPSKAKGLGGVRFPRSKNAPTLYIYRQHHPFYSIMSLRYCGNTIIVVIHHNK